MTARRAAVLESVELVQSLTIDEDHLVRLIAELTSIGSSALGFRTTGTVEDAAVAACTARELRRAGLSDVAIEDVEVDAWRFLSATVAVPGSASFTDVEASSFGGVPGTPPAGLTGRLVDVGDARRRTLDRHDLTDAVVLVDWRDPDVEPAAVVLELMLRHVLAVVLTSPEGGPWYQSPGALGAFDGHWPPGAPPMVTIRKEDAHRLRRELAAGPVEVTVSLEVETEAGVAGHNVVGYLDGERDEVIVVGAHHDAWFRGAFDNTSGVAALVQLARALVDAGVRPKHRICFTTRTAEEHGIAHSAFDWCIGAWQQVTRTHPEWRDTAAFHLCLEASGHPGLRTVVESPPELARWSRRVCRAAEGRGWTPTGWRVAPPTSGTEQWPLLVEGIPGVAAYAWEASFGRTDYHTQRDTPDLLDPGILAAQTRLYALLLLEADRDPDAVLDHAARARQLASVASRTGHRRLAEAATRHASARGRAVFSAVGRGLFALDARGHVASPHEQASADLAALDAALAALEAGDSRTAARALRRVGAHHLFPYLSDPAMRAHTRRLHPEALTRTWAASSHLTPSPHLWAELATLTAEAGARPAGPWLPASLERARDATRALLDDRLTRMAEAVDPHSPDGPAAGPDHA